MKRTLYCLFGAGLLVVWAIGMTHAGTAGWITAWLDALAAIWAFALAVSCHDRSVQARQSRQTATLFLAGGLFALWGLDIAAGVTPWMVWWNFTFGVLFAFLAPLPDEFRRKHAPVVPFRKSA